mgnify:CR=1 FL=1
MNEEIIIGKIKTSKTELIDLTKAWVVISLAFAAIFTGANLMEGTIGRIISLNFVELFFWSLVTTGIGFLLHELGHKFAAQHYGCVAEFRAWDQMLYFALGLAVVIGFLFAAPGAVMISGMITRKENGIISLAGPAVNYVLAMIFFGLAYFFPYKIFSWGVTINIWLGLFNMIPFGNFDGIKIFYWNKWIWCGMVVLGIGGYFWL